MNVDEAVESILVSLQWDRWRFMLPAKPILNLDAAVVSHGHMDHWHRNFYHKDLILVPWEVRVPKQFAGLRNILRVNHHQFLKRMYLVKINGRDLRRLLSISSIPTPHSIWWIAASSGTRVLFIGDMNVADVETAKIFVEEMFRVNQPLHGLILPSFGGVLGHGAKKAMEISHKIADLAYHVRDEYNVKLGGLPHPVDAEWADYNAIKV